MISKIHLFVQLYRCRFKKNITVEDCRELVKCSPKRVAGAIKILLERQKVKRIICEKCELPLGKDEILREVQMFGVFKKICGTCNYLWKYGERVK